MDLNRYEAQPTNDVLKVKLALQILEESLQGEIHPRQPYDEKEREIVEGYDRLYAGAGNGGRDDDFMDEFRRLGKMLGDQVRDWEERGQGLVREHQQRRDLYEHIFWSKLSKLGPFATNRTEEPVAPEVRRLHATEGSSAGAGDEPAVHHSIYLGHRQFSMPPAHAAAPEAQMTLGELAPSRVDEEASEFSFHTHLAPEAYENNDYDTNRYEKTQRDSDDRTMQSGFLKRPASSSWTKEQPPNKLQQRPIPTIDFRDVYQDGNAPHKYTIIRSTLNGIGPEDFYILRCEEHNLHLAMKPLAAAGRHLRSKYHHLSGLNRETVLNCLGVRVLNCSEKLQELNNETAKEYHKFKRDQKLLARSNTLKQSKSLEISARTTKPSIGILEPKPGSVYFAVFGKSTQKWPVVVLSKNNKKALPGFTADEPLSGLALTQKIPQCWGFENSTGKFLGLKESSIKGRGRAMDRWWPVMSVGEDFPENGSIGGVQAKDLSEYNPSELTSSTLRNIIDDYIQGIADGHPPVTTSESGEELQVSSAFEQRARQDYLCRRSVALSSIQVPTRQGPFQNPAEASIAASKGSAEARTQSWLDGLQSERDAHNSVTETRVPDRYVVADFDTGTGTPRREVAGSASNATRPPLTQARVARSPTLIPDGLLEVDAMLTPT